MTLILGIETSCDETAAAVVEDGRLVRSNVIASQHDLHAKYGGVVPEIASRAHLERITPVINEALTNAGVALADLDAVAVGNRPGLIGSLLVGVSAAKSLAWTLGKPLIGVDHVRAHLYAGFLEKSEGRGAKGEARDGLAAGAMAGLPGRALNDPSQTRPDMPAMAPESHRPSPLAPRPSSFPALGLVVSGGHTSLYDLDSPLEMRLLGRTIDDAVGEAYDKAAVILDLGYPGGPKLDKLAQTAPAPPPAAAAGQRGLPQTLLSEGSLDFSFSGLKTALLYAVRGKPRGRGEATTFERTAADLTDEQRRAFAAEFQHVAVDTLIKKVERGIDAMVAAGRSPRTFLIGGGVSANALLRKRVVELGQRNGLTVRVPAMEFCLDNAAMIAGLAFEHFEQSRFDSLDLPAIATTAM